MAQTTSLTYLIPDLRLHLGDITLGEYRYLDEWLEVALIGAVQALMPWWKFRYLINGSDEVYRNSQVSFKLSEPPVIQVYDERPIILMSGIIIKSGTLENSAWSLGSWKDREISFSNIEGGRTRRANLQRDWDELTSMLTPPKSRLAGARKQSLPGYHNDPLEHETNR